MKKLITLSIIFVLTSIVLISCKSSSSVMKRRYNKGYYVHHTAKHSEPKPGKTVKNKEAVQSPALAETIVVAPAVKETISPSLPNITAGANTTAKSTVAKHSKNTISTIPAEYSIAKPFKTLKNIGTKINSSDAAGDALSLLWILIVVVLILYLLSFLFNGYGLGGFVHLLAVIFLVLLILWLLRII